MLGLFLGTGLGTGTGASVGVGGGVVVILLVLVAGRTLAGGLGRGLLGTMGRCLGTDSSAVVEIGVSASSFLSVGSSCSAAVGGLAGGDGGGPEAFTVPLGETLPAFMERCLGIMGMVGRWPFF